jgi:hypothetical protein
VLLKTQGLRRGVPVVYLRPHVNSLPDGEGRVQPMNPEYPGLPKWFCGYLLSFHQIKGPGRCVSSRASNRTWCIAGLQYLLCRGSREEGTGKLILHSRSLEGLSRVPCDRLCALAECL